VERALAAKHCFPVFCGTKEASYHYQGVCKSVLWPLFHNVIDLFNEVEVHDLNPFSSSSPTPSGPEGQWERSRSFNPQELESLWPYHMDMMTKFSKVIKAIYSVSTCVAVFFSSGDISREALLAL
jgi:trehalose 6-phosphate synthase/phosphatase